MRETTSSSGAASSSGSLNGCTPRQMPLASSRIWWNSAFGTVGTKETPSTSSRASTIAQPDLDIVVGSSSFLRLVDADCAMGVPRIGVETSLSYYRHSPASGSPGSGYAVALDARFRGYDEEVRWLGARRLEIGQLVDRRDIGAVP